MSHTLFKVSLVTARALLALVVTAWLSTASAQTVTANVATDVQVKLVLERITVGTGKDAGKEVVVSTERAAPGELMQYVATYSNTAAVNTPPIGKLQATLPVPSAMHYSGIAQPIPALASTDGKSYEAYPIVRMMKQADGTVKRVEVPFEEYRSLRWTLQDLAPQTAQSVKARMRVINTVTAVSATKQP
jgi:hypothetical protein